VRNLFLVLLLANLAFAAWHAWFAQPSRPTHVVDPSLPSITLVKELPDDVATLSGASNQPANLPRQTKDGVDALADVAPAASSAADGAVAPERADEVAARVESSSTRVKSTPAAPAARSGIVAGARCTSVGPFRELAQAATAAATLRTAGYQPTQRVAEGDIWIGYWVYIEAIPTVAVADEILSKVRAEGVTDSYVIPNTDSGNLVSLGVFSEISGVSRRREQVRALGYEPKVVDRTRRATVYWVDVVLKGDQVLDFDALQTPGRIIRLEQRSCEAPAA
jgi:cell division septation protein DedD